MTTEEKFDWFGAIMITAIALFALGVLALFICIAHDVGYSEGMRRQREINPSLRQSRAEHLARVLKIEDPQIECLGTHREEECECLLSYGGSKLIRPVVMRLDCCEYECKPIGEDTNDEQH